MLVKKLSLHIVNLRTTYLFSL
jgi:hypothetical protein